MPPKTEEQKKSQKNYMKKFSRLQIRVTHEKQKEIQTHAENHGESVNAFVTRAIDEQMGRDNADMYNRGK